MVSIKETEEQLSKATRSTKADKKQDDSDDVDTLDSYMKDLKSDRCDKSAISKMKADLTKLKADHARVVKLINLAKPADLPPLVSQYSQEGGSKIMPIFGKRNKSKFKLVSDKAAVRTETKDAVKSNEEEVEEEDEEEKKETAECKEQNRNVEMEEHITDPTVVRMVFQKKSFKLKNCYVLLEVGRSYRLSR